MSMSIVEAIAWLCLTLALSLGGIGFVLLTITVALNRIAKAIEARR